MHLAPKISLKPCPGLSLKTFPVLLLLFFGSLQEAHSQVSDDFSDGEFLSAPSWFGKTEDFVVNDLHELQLNATAAGTSWLSTAFSLGPSDGAEWQFFIRQSFDPSAANFGRFYIVSDQADLSGPLNGYYLQFGESGSGDAVELFYQSGTSRTSVCKAEAGTIASAFALRVKVSYATDGSWRLYIDYTGGKDFALNASGTHRNEIPRSYCGMLCTYTVSNTSRFYLDDVNIERISLPDTTPASITDIKVMNSRSLVVSFSEPLDRNSVESDDFSVSPKPGKAVDATLDSAGMSVVLLFDGPFWNGEVSVLQVGGLSDLAGNVMASTDRTFLFFEEQPVAFGDVTINEIFPDPIPPVDLPEAEFVELFNRSDNPVNLEGWTLSDPSASAMLPAYILQSGGHVILTSTLSSDAFEKYGSVVAVTKFPSLNNAGDIVKVMDDEGQPIDSVKYLQTWYRNGDKSEGGWTLERIDPGNFCLEEGNWTASEAPAGGTPGERNSVFATQPDNTGPRIESVVPVDSAMVVVTFNERLDVTLPSTTEFQVEGGPEVRAVAFLTPSRISLEMTPPLEAGNVYTLRVGHVFDCTGNVIDAQYSQATFVLPGRAYYGDIVINEILFNPRPTGFDFIELYNPSDKVVDLKDWTFRNTSSGSAHPFALAGENMLIHAGEYKVFTENANALKGEYLMADERAFTEIDLPPLNDDEGYVTLLRDEDMIIDSIYFSHNMHSSFVKDAEGISLERISPHVDGLQQSNWRSAASSAGYATPGYLNSNARSETQMNDGPISVEPEVIQQAMTPDDFARIKYQFQNGGMMVNIKVFDQQGRPVRTVAENEIIGTEGSFRWDADTDRGMPASTGYYMIWVQVFDLDGTIRTFRKRVAVF